MTLLHILKTFEQIHKIKIGKSLKRVDSDCIFWCSRLYRDPALRRHKPINVALPTKIASKKTLLLLALYH